MQEISIAKNSPVEVETDITMGLFPQVKHAVDCKTEDNTVKSLLARLAFVSNSEGPLRMELPIPNAIRNSKPKDPNAISNNNVQC